jgi:tetratricopeptide (TPR) repeat protein
MRRTLVVLALVAAAGVAGALAYASYNTEQDFVRLVAQGDEAAGDGRTFEALQAYSGALALVPDAVVAYLKRGRVYQLQGEAEAALRDLKRAAELDPSASRPLEWLGDISLDLNRLDRASEYFQRYVALDDRNARVLYKLGVARYRAGAAREALQVLDQALQIDPALNDARFLRALCQRDLGQPNEARSTLEEVVAAAPGARGPREALAEVYASLGEHQRAIDSLEALSALDPSRPEALVAVGLAYAGSGRDTQALQVLGRAVERFPDSPLAYSALGRVWLNLAERHTDHVALLKAIEALAEAGTHATSSSAALSDLGRALTLSGDYAGAERALRQAVARLPASTDAFLRLAAVTEKQGRLPEARDALLQYAALVGDREPIAPVATRIADLSLRIGEPLLAARWLDRAIDESGPSPALLARLADAAWRGGDLVRAREALAAGLELAPEHPALVGLKRRVGADPGRP